MLTPPRPAGVGLPAPPGTKPAAGAGASLAAPGNSVYPLRPMGAVSEVAHHDPTGRKGPASDRKRELLSLILAAGLGKRMQSRTSKLLHAVAGRPMVRHVIEATKGAGVARTVVVIGSQADEVRGAIGDHDKRIAFAFQKDQLGTGHAVLCAERQLQGHQGDVLILNGDLPSLRPETLQTFVAFHRSHGAPLSLLTTVIPEPHGYGRVIRNYGGDVSRIVEETDATPEERATQEINCGIYCVDSQALFRPLRQATRDNAQGEIYLTDLVEILRKEGRKIAAYRHPESREVLGVNDRRELAAAALALYKRKADALMLSGVSLIDPGSTYIDTQVTIGRDSTIEPGVMIQGDTRIGAEVRIGCGSRLFDCQIGDGTEILPYSVIASSRVGRGCRIGPFAHLRPDTTLDEGARIGNFVETKKSRLGRGSKANHLAYLGDAEIGRDVNIGAGTITCNYDGVAKHRTIIEDDVFIGSDTQLVAPVRVKRGAFVGAGSTITKDVPSHALALSRARQETKEGWARRFGPAARRNGPSREGG
ncbi:MAG TPA: bifunctional UDP-N-acetylglucosamine diphosphorylase/glucosamine-1-phosphate N-acetyltransferase GlmU [Candidatus Cryosericum sp.]|nr:bifunctional UDP-N-acetylglucosamine diphosphorylase/glucosamine-1-phosphate N-acetyltransferase GlmU [Candidatus Cryosericum sp.]